MVTHFRDRLIRQLVKEFRTVNRQFDWIHLVGVHISGIYESEPFSVFIMILFIYECP